MGMRRWRRAAHLLLLTATLAAIGSTPAARAGDEPPAERSPADEGGEQPGRGRSRHERLEHLTSRLGLDAAKQADIQKIVGSARRQGAPLRERTRALREELRTTLAGDAPDSQAVMRLADKIGEAETALHKHRLRTMLRIRELLTPEQRRELVRLFEERRSRRGERGPEPAGPR